MSINHYENFPVASFLLPRKLRPAVQAIYRFARTADDIADEGNASPAERLASLHAYAQALDAIHATVDIDPMAPRTVFEPLAAVIRRFNLPITPFQRLLSAFRQDVTVTQYDDADALFDYCTRSANPVGELILLLYKHCTDTNLRDSNAICTGLQLANFCQDVAIDQAKGRVYIPRSDLAEAGLDTPDLSTQRHTPAWQNVMQLQVQRARRQLCTGGELALRLPGRIGWELRLVVCGGLRILERIEAVHYNVFDARPQLNAHDWLAMCRQAVRYRNTLRNAAAVS